MVGRKTSITTCGFVMTAALALLMLTGGASALSNSGGGSWQYNKDITISNTGNSLTDYQVLLSLTGNNFPADAQTSGADIRFTDAVGTELSYWIENWYSSGKSAKIWVKVPSIPVGSTTTIRMWYGNPSAGSSSNGDATFVFFDDFESGTLNKWDKVFSGASVVSDNSNHVLKLYSSDPSMKYIRKNIVPADIRLDLKYKIIQNGDYDGARFGSFLRTNYWYQLADWHFLDIGAPARTLGVDLGDFLGSPATMLDKKQIPYYSALGVWYYWGFSAVGSSSVELKGYGKDGEVIVSAVDTVNPLPAGQLKLWVWDTGATVYVDDVRVRKYASPEPSVSLSAEQPILKVPSLTLTKSLSPSTITEGDTTTITIRVENTGGDAKTVKIADAVPQGFTLVSGATSQEYSTLKGGEYRTFQYTMKAIGTGRFITDLATVTYQDDKGNSYSGASNSATITVQSSLPKDTPTSTLPQPKEPKSIPGFEAFLAIIALGILTSWRKTN